MTSLDQGTECHNWQTLQEPWQDRSRAAGSQIDASSSTESVHDFLNHRLVQCSKVHGLRPRAGFVKGFATRTDVFDTSVLPQQKHPEDH